MAKSSSKSTSQRNKSNGASKASGKAVSKRTGSRQQPSTGSPALVSYLGRAAGKERHIEAALAAHLVMTTRPTYHGRLESHLRDTKVRAEKLEGRMKSLGGSPRSISAPGSAVMGDVKDAAKMVADRALALAKGSLEAMREDHEAPSLLENVRVEYADASEQIATYAVVRALAKAAGDKDTGKLAKDFGAEHADMAEFLEKLIPKLSSAVVKTEARTESKGSTSSSAGGSSGSSRGNASGGRASSGGASRGNRSSGRASSGGSSPSQASASKSGSSGKSAAGSRSARGGKTAGSTSGQGGKSSGGARSRPKTSSSGSSRSSAPSSSGARSRSSSGGGSGAGRQKAKSGS